MRNGCATTRWKGSAHSRQRLHLFGADVLVLDDFSYDIASPNSTRTLAALGSYDERTQTLIPPGPRQLKMRVLGYRLDRDKTQDLVSAPDIVKHPEETRSKSAGEKAAPVWQMVSAALPP